MSRNGSHAHTNSSPVRVQQHNLQQTNLNESNIAKSSLHSVSVNCAQVQPDILTQNIPHGAEQQNSVNQIQSNRHDDKHCQSNKKQSRKKKSELEVLAEWYIKDTTRTKRRTQILPTLADIGDVESDILTAEFQIDKAPPKKRLSGPDSVVVLDSHIEEVGPSFVQTTERSNQSFINHLFGDKSLHQCCKPV